MTSQKQIPRILVAGIGGFASMHHSALADLEEAGVCKVVATCDPAIGRLGNAVTEFRFAERGVAVYEDFDEMLTRWGDSAEMASVATPIPCHEPMHRKCVRAGLACYLEKPPTLDPQALERMITTDSEARVRTNVGFNYVFEARRFALKQRILNGEFGPLRSVGFLGLWSRNREYFERNNWAGRLRLGDDLVLDSCFANAMAHHIQNVFFWAGNASLNAYASPTRAQVELYRVQKIESMDTVFAKFATDGGVEVRIAASHSCIEPDLAIERLICENAVLEISPNHSAIIRPDGRREVEECEPAGFLANNLKEFMAYQAGDRPRPVVLLEETRAFVQANALLFLASPGINPIEDGVIEHTFWKNEVSERLVIPGIVDIGNRLVSDGQMPSEQGIAWSGKTGVAEVTMRAPN
jgi:predicted dehydrogenase